MKQKNKTKKIYYCKECDNIISYQSALYGSNLCFNCSQKYKNLKHGKTSKSIIYRCKCGNQITYQTALYGKKSCHDCSNKLVSLKMKNQKAWNKGIKNSTNKYWLGKSNKNIIIKHHIDLESNSDRTMSMTQGQHRSLHWKCYEYLVLIGEVKKYLKEFIKKYEINILKADGKIIHHIDCNRENNKDINFLYLPSKAIHNKLHQEAYEYLVNNSMVDSYIKWFIMENKTTMVNI